MRSNFTFSPFRDYAVLTLFKAAWYPENPSKEDERMMAQFMNAFARFYPCVSTFHLICINNEALKCRLFYLEIHYYVALDELWAFGIQKYLQYIACTAVHIVLISFLPCFLFFVVKNVQFTDILCQGLSGQFGEESSKDY